MYGLRQRRNMAIVFLAHKGLKRSRFDGLTQANMRCSPWTCTRTAPASVLSQSDAVIYIKHDEFVTGQETSKKGQVTRYGRLVQSGRHKLITKVATA